MINLVTITKKRSVGKDQFLSKCTFITPSSVLNNWYIILKVLN